MNYTVDYFIEKFSAIPDEKWCTGAYEREFIDGAVARCALGHCKNVEFSKLCELMPEVVQINDGKESGYKQPTPKARILAALHDIKSKESAC